MKIVSEVVAGLVAFVYCSFFEWYVHRYIMHVKRWPLHDAFRGHTLVHHQIYHGENYMMKTPGRYPHVTLRWYAFPGMLGFHVPFFLLFQWLTGLPTFWGAMIACTLYFSGYEYTHYLMHVPCGHYVERFRWFLFLRNHHRLHHKYMLRNLNVFIPLADACIGTLVTSEGWRSKEALKKKFVDAGKPTKRHRVLLPRRSDKKASVNAD